MKLDETYNIHKKINCIFSFFKSDKMCKKGLHNYRINPNVTYIPHTYTEDIGDMTITKVTRYERIDLTNLKCYCCGKEEILDD